MAGLPRKPANLTSFPKWGTCLRLQGLIFLYRGNLSHAGGACLQLSLGFALCHVVSKKLAKAEAFLPKL